MYKVWCIVGTICFFQIQAQQKFMALPQVAAISMQQKLSLLRNKHPVTYAHLLLHCIKLNGKEWPIPSSWYNNHCKVLRDYRLLATDDKPVFPEIIAIFKAMEATLPVEVLKQLSEALPSIFNWPIFDTLPIDKG